MTVPIPDGFFYPRPDYATGCGDSGYYLSYHHGRDGDTLKLCHDTENLSNDVDGRCRILCFCSCSSRPLNDGERQLGEDIDSSVYLWAVGEHVSERAEIEGRWNAREFLRKYFEYMSNGHILSGRTGDMKRRLVEVTFGSAWYGINR